MTNALRAVTKCFPPLHHHPTGQRKGAGLPLPRTGLNPEGPLMGYLALGVSLHTLGTRCYLLSWRLMTKVQPHSETGQALPGRIYALFLMQFEPNIGLLCEAGLFEAEAVSLSLVRSSRSCPGGRGMDATALAELPSFPAARAALRLDRTGCEGVQQGSGGGGTPWRGYPRGMMLLATHSPRQQPPLDKRQPFVRPAQPELPLNRLPSVPSSAQHKNWD